MATKKKTPTLVKTIPAKRKPSTITPDQLLDKKEEEMKDMIKCQILKMREIRSQLNKEETRLERLALIYGGSNVDQCYKELDSANAKSVAAR